MTIRWFAITPASTPHHAAAAKVCHLALASPSPDSAALLPPTKTRTQFILYFDGGSRGNPGPGGSGSLIAKVGGANIAPVIEWMASVSYAKRTTNNIAEYQGLLVGLRYASRHRLHGLHVVSDSAMILNQLRQRKAPAARHLQGVYPQCRLLTDRLQVSSWTHHLRQFNKVADRLANIAMDTKSSTQVFGDDLCRLPPLWTPVLELLQGDVTHWIDLHPDEEEDSRPSVQRGPV